MKKNLVSIMLVLFLVINTSVTAMAFDEDAKFSDLNNRKSIEEIEEPVEDKVEERQEIEEDKNVKGGSNNELQSAFDEKAQITDNLEFLDSAKMTSLGAPANNTPPVGPVPTEDLKEISSWDDLKAELEYSNENGVYTSNNFNVPRLLLKNKKYKLTGDITIDMNDNFFNGKEKWIQNGILSAGYIWQTRDDEGFWHDQWLIDNFDFDGNNHKITIIPKNGEPAPALFGGVYAEKLKIHNINLEVQGDSLGYPFMEVIKSSVGEDKDKLYYVNGLIEDINVNVTGSVVPITQFEDNSNRPWLKRNDYALGNFIGSFASGFGIKPINVNLNRIKVNVNGNIGSETAYNLTNADKELIKKGINYSAASFGFLWNAEGANDLDPKSETYKKIFSEKNYNVIRNCGYIENIDINVGGSIVATGYDNAYAGGFMGSSNDAWLDKINIDIKGDIKSTLIGGDDGCNHYGNDSQQTSYATGFCESLTNLTNSKLNVNKIIMNVADAYKTSTSNGTQNTISKLLGIGYDSDKSPLIRLVNNEVNIEGGLEATTPINLIANAGFYNSWESNDKQGVDWAHFYENNNINVGPINLKGTKDKLIQYYGLGKKFRTGVLDQSEIDKGHSALDEVSAKNNSLKVESVNVVNESGDAYIYPSFYNAANAKNNTITYGKIDINSKGGAFAGLGNLINDEPSLDNQINEVTEGNVLKFGDISIKGNSYQNISLGANIIDENKTMKNNKINCGQVDVELGKLEDGRITSANDENFYFGGLSYYNMGNIEDSHLFVKNIKLRHISSPRDIKHTYFGLGASFNKANIKDSTVLVDNDIDIQSIGNLYEGNFIGYSNGGEIKNCHAQVNGIFAIGVSELGSPFYGSFAGWLKNTKVTESSGLMFNGFSPFAFMMNGGSLDKVANYSNEGGWQYFSDTDSWQYFSGLLVKSDKTNKPTITNSTYIVDKFFEYTDGDGNKHLKNNENSVVYRDDNVSSDSKNNYIVIVGKEGEDEYNRLAYKLEKRKSTNDEMGNTTTDVWAKGKDAKPVGKINIAGRSFQDKYWGVNAKEYQTGDAEKEFIYMDKNPDKLEIKSFGRYKTVVETDGKLKDRANLLNYYDRHVGLYVENGPIYDLLGIKGYPIPKPEPPKPEPPKPEPPKPEPPKPEPPKPEPPKPEPPKPEPIPEEPTIEFKPHEYVERHPVNAIIRDKALEELIHEKYIFGYPEDIIKPEGNMTRAEAVSVVARLQKLPQEDGSKIFKDTKDSAWYNKAINAAYKAGYLEEKEGENFRPDEKITRAELAQLISHIDKKNNKIAPFEDIKGHKYEKAINMAYGNERIKGYPDGTFRPDEKITRAEVASMLNKLYNRYPDKTFIDANKDKIHTYKDLTNTHWAYYELVEAYETHKYHRLANNMEEWIDIIK